MFIKLVSHYGAISVLIILILEYFGLPLPGETIMTFLGFLCWKNNGQPFFIPLGYALAGTLLGSTLAWFIGIRYGEGIVLRYGRYIHISREKLNSAGNTFQKHNVLFLLLGRYIPGVRAVIPYICGISKLKFSKFLILNLLGSFIWCTSFIGLGFLLGEKWMSVASLIKTYSLILILLFIFILTVIKFFNKYKKIIFAISFPTLMFIKLIEDLIRNELSVFDSTIYSLLRNLMSTNMTIAMRIITFFGSGSAFVPISLICLMKFWNSKKYSFSSKMIVLNLASVSILNEVFKILFHRERPDILRLVSAGGFSFPSGHSMISTVFYGYIAYLLYVNIKKGWKYMIISLLSALILLIGISRVYLGVHYASDVLAGFSAGLAWLAVFITLSNRAYVLTVRK